MKIFKKTVIIFIGIFITALFGYSQSVLLEQDVESISYEKEKGKNLKKFTHFYIGYGLILPLDDKAVDISIGNSYSFDFGIMHKRKISNLYSIGYNLSYSYNYYRLKRGDDDIIPDSIKHDIEAFRTSEIRLGLYNRFNFDLKRGNFIGRFIDIGVYSGYLFYTDFYKKDKSKKNKSINIEKNPEYLEDFNYGAFVNVGFNRYLITFNYRVSDLFNLVDSEYDVPRLSVGIRIGFY